MPDETGTFQVDIEIENPARPGVKRLLRSLLVDTGAELSWVPGEVLESLGVEKNGRWRFRQADGTVLERWTGTVAIHLAGKRAGDEVGRARHQEAGRRWPRPGCRIRWHDGINKKRAPLLREPPAAMPLCRRLIVPH